MLSGKNLSILFTASGALHGWAAGAGGYPGISYPEGGGISELTNRSNNNRFKFNFKQKLLRRVVGKSLLSYYHQDNKYKQIISMFRSIINLLRDL